MVRSIVAVAVLLAAMGASSVAQACGPSPNCLPHAVSHAMATAADGQHVALPPNWTHQHLVIGHCAISLGQFTKVMAVQMGPVQYKELGGIIAR
jgi:hypothetical protein